jgi:hypothetical protein
MTQATLARAERAFDKTPLLLVGMGIALAVAFFLLGA